MLKSGFSFLREGASFVDVPEAGLPIDHSTSTRLRPAMERGTSHRRMAGYPSVAITNTTIHVCTCGFKTHAHTCARTLIHIQTHTHPSQPIRNTISLHSPRCRCNQSSARTRSRLQEPLPPVGRQFWRRRRESSRRSRRSTRKEEHVEAGGWNCVWAAEGEEGDDGGGGGLRWVAQTMG